jgi:hypothetical protein
MIFPGIQRNGRELAAGPAHATPLASKRVDSGLLIQDGVADCSELTQRNAGPAPGAGPLVYFGHVLAFKKDLQPVLIGKHGQAVRAVAIAYRSDKWCLESPQGMYKAIFFERAVQFQGFLRRKAFEKLFSRPRPERFQESFLYI